MRSGLDWGCDDPVFFDFETTSACDLPARGGRNYAACPTTKILSLVVDDGGTYHIWIPRLDEADIPSEAFLTGYGVQLSNLRIYTGQELPFPINEIINSGRTWVGHNVMGFDRYIMSRLGNDLRSPKFADTIYLARSAGLPGSLDKVASTVLNSGKDSAKRLVMPLTQATWKNGSLIYPPLHKGLIGPLLRYNMVDVILLRQLWYGEFAELEVEADILDAHQIINDTGVKADKEFLEFIHYASIESMSRAAERVAKLTNNEINEKNIRSVKQVREWLARKGLRIMTVDKEGNEKHTLRKDIVEQCINNPYLMLDPDNPVAVDVENLDPTIFEVLRLRAASVRITASKADRAMDRICDDGRIYDLHAYHQAHTGRFGSIGLNIHNLPKAKSGLSKKAQGYDAVQYIIRRFKHDRWGMPDVQKSYELLNKKCEQWTENIKRGNPRALGVSVDDALSACIRPSLVADLDPGAGVDDVFGIADYAAIEARGLPWIAGCQKLLDAFNRGEDVYTWFGNEANLFGRIISKKDKDERDICKVAVLGLGYGMGEKKFTIFLGMNGIDLNKYGLTPWNVIDKYRGFFPEIAGKYAGNINGRPYRKGGIWTQLEQAAMLATAGEGPQNAGKCRFVHDGKNLRCRLPAGRTIFYRNARIEDRVPAYVYALGLEPIEKATLVYDNPQGYESSLFGSKLTENVVQAICRDIMACSLVRLIRAGMKPVLHVHDEIVCQFPRSDMDKEICRQVELMTTVPEWAKGFPIMCEGYCSDRYTKSAPKGYAEAEATNGIVTKSKRAM